MFEKEAEEYREKEKDKGYYWVTQEMEQSELDTIIDESFKDGAEFGYNKANEWHYVKDGKYPKDEKRVLCILGDFENDNLEVGYYSQVEGDSERWRFEDYDLPDDSEEGWGVSAWKEIVLPKESE